MVHSRGMECCNIDGMELFAKNLPDADMKRQVDTTRSESENEMNPVRKNRAPEDPTPSNLKIPRELAAEFENPEKTNDDEVHPELEQAYKDTERALQRMLSAAIAFCDGIISDGQLRAVRELLREQELRLTRLEGKYTPPFIDESPVPAVIQDPQIVTAPPIQREPESIPIDLPINPPASRGELTGMLLSLDQKLARLEEDFRQGRVNNSQYRAIQKHYIEQKEVAKRLRQTHPDSDRWKVVLEEGKTSFLLQLNEAAVRSIAFYDLKSRERIFLEGDVPIDAEEAIALLGTFSATEVEPQTGRMVATHADDGTALVLIPGRYTVALVSFSQDPPGWQVRALREVHRNFEAANRVALERGERRSLIFPNMERFFKS
jgi:hypothetical protein